MAQDSTPTGDDTGFSQIMQELQEIKRKAAVDAAILAQLQEKQEKREVKQQKEQKQESKEQNVVKKLPTVLTTNERKRYAEIGKRFLIGAQQQFQQVKKGLKMKQMMKTTKDFFLKGFDRIKEEKAKSKKKSFWKILLGSLVVIGLAAYLFRDKIAKMMPDLAGQSGGLFKRITSYLGTMLKGCWEFVTKSIGGSIVCIFQRVFTQSIPKIIQIFFFETLPEAIFNTYLAIMSQFDPRANEMYHDPSVKQDVENATAEGGEFDTSYKEAQNRAIDEGYGALHGMTGLMQKLMTNQAMTEAEMTFVYERLGRMLLIQQNGVPNINNPNAFYNEKDLSHETAKRLMQQAHYILYGGNGWGDDFSKSKFYKLIQSGDFNLEQFLITYLKSQDIQAALKAGRNGVALDGEAIKRAEAMAASWINDIKDETVDAYQISADAFTHLGQVYQTYVNAIDVRKRGIASDSNPSFIPIQQSSPEQEVQKINAGLGYINLSFKQDIIASQVNKFLQAANKFVYEGNITSVISTKIEAMVTSMEQYFKDFFLGTLDVLKSVLYGIISYTETKDGVQSAKTANHPLSSLPNNNTGIIVNVDMRGNEQSVLVLLISNLVRVENNIVDSIKGSNDKLDAAIKALANVKNLHCFSTGALGGLAALIGEVTGENKLVNGTIISQVLENKDNIDKLIKDKNAGEPMARVLQTTHSFT